MIGIVETKLHVQCSNGAPKVLDIFFCGHFHKVAKAGVLMRIMDGVLNDTASDERLLVEELGGQVSECSLGDFLMSGFGMSKHGIERGRGRYTGGGIERGFTGDGACGGDWGGVCLGRWWWRWGRRGVSVGGIMKDAIEI